MSDNPLVTLDLSNNTMLKSIYTVNHQISDIAIMEDIYSQMLNNAKANNITNGILFTYNNINDFGASQAIVDASNELTNDFKWIVSY